MKLKFWASLVLFLASYLPLSVILLAQNFDLGATQRDLCIVSGQPCALPFANPILAIGTFAVCAICLILTILVLRLTKGGQSIDVLRAKHVSNDLMNYTLPYVVSFMGLGYDDGKSLFGFMVFLFWMFVISYRSGRVLMNPVLIVLGWRLYEIDYKFSASSSEKSGLMLSKVEPSGRVVAPKIEDILVLKGS